MSLITSKLFEKALVEPLKNGANTLYVVSGYATAMMVMRHAHFARTLKKGFSIRLIVGMCPLDGIDKKNHLAFKDLQTNKFEIDFKCNYVIDSPPVHSKIYAWYKDKNPIAGFVGSANYTQSGFSSSMREILIEEDAKTCREYFFSLLDETVNCDNENIQELINIYDRILLNKKVLIPDESDEVNTVLTSNILNLPNVTLTFLEKKGEVPSRSGLNWGQRKGREPNQAYINIPAKIGRSGFFPDRYKTFTIFTDDKKQFICVRAQDSGKGIHTTLNNSLLGEYFRYRLNLSSGSFITKDDLVKYGRTDVTFYKIDEENYLMDFSVR
ncbi:MAG: hypothetical protein HGGPFJEG_02729 [Ignavibacteria bacterium]|nr:hypothetical protein [Ignavibacteria bacterium]